MEEAVLIGLLKPILPVVQYYLPFGLAVLVPVVAPPVELDFLWRWCFLWCLPDFGVVDDFAAVDVPAGAVVAVPAGFFWLARADPASRATITVPNRAIRFIRLISLCNRINPPIDLAASPASAN